ncbi:light-harvesting complex-like protein OHP1, chloroplastic [Malania oleifera]|uniref:light-harvesting complex-like protein OHP1, chloroplastic n=1 Tax=Malania oleifera TaxID=397392 RepID=UPI0025AE0145|nr:light-harvesting complex-like protein OHP1, chloroplastic [Malania oleifera]
MASSSSSASVAASSLSHLPARAPLVYHPTQKLSLFHTPSSRGTKQRRLPLRIQSAKLPAGVDLPKAEPRFQAPVLGFTKTAEVWNSRACMIGLIGTFIVELIFNKGILQMIGVDVGKGLDLPL